MKTKILAAMAGAYVLFAFYNYRNQSPLDSSNSTLTNILGAFGMNNLTTSQAGLNAIAEREGTSYTVYRDTAGYLTAGIGHKLRPGDGIFSVGDTVAPATIDKWFASDISHAENIVSRYTVQPLSQNEFDALVSAAFNLGDALFRNADGSQTHFSAALDAGNYSGAADYLLSFDHVRVNGALVVDNGLSARRQSEQQQFLA